MSTFYEPTAKDIEKLSLTEPIAAIIHKAYREGKFTDYEAMLTTMVFEFYKQMKRNEKTLLTHMERCVQPGPVMLKQWKCPDCGLMQSLLCEVHLGGCSKTPSRPSP